MPPTILFNELNRTELRRRAPETLLVLPTAATEQHGPYLPVGTDCFEVEAVARTAAEKASAQISVLVAPTLPFGSSHHHLPWGATLSLSSDAYYKAVFDLVRTIVVDGGFRRVFLLNGHGGNDVLNQLVARDIAVQFPANVAAGSHWAIAWDALIEAGAATRGHVPGHAGDFEASLVLAIRPELVSTERPTARPGVAPGPAELLPEPLCRTTRVLSELRRPHGQLAPRQRGDRAALPPPHHGRGRRGVRAVLPAAAPSGTRRAASVTGPARSSQPARVSALWRAIPKRGAFDRCVCLRTPAPGRALAAARAGKR